MRLHKSLAGYLPKSPSTYLLLGFIAFFYHSCEFHNQTQQKEFNPNFTDPGFIEKNYVDQDPIQEMLTEEKSIHWGEYVIKPKARYRISGMILSRQSYQETKVAPLSSLDLAIGWRFMSNPAFLKHMSFKQSGRFLYWDMLSSPQPSQLHSWNEINMNASNNHIIAADPSLNFKLEYLKPGDVVQLDGYLVKVVSSYNPDFVVWNSSETRADEGKGACEVFYVKSVKML